MEAGNPSLPGVEQEETRHWESENWYSEFSQCRNFTVVTFNKRMLELVGVYKL